MGGERQGMGAVGLILDYGREAHSEREDHQGQSGNLARKNLLGGTILQVEGPEEGLLVKAFPLSVSAR